MDQLNALMDFIEANPELALGRCSRSMEGRSLSKRLWRECAEMLNNISPNVSKTADGWRLYFNDFKSKLLKKIKQQKGEYSATGGGPAQNIELTPIQDRLYTILGRDVGAPLPGVRHNPLTQENNTEAQGGSGPQNDSIINFNDIDSRTNTIGEELESELSPIVVHFNDHPVHSTPGLSGVETPPGLGVGGTRPQPSTTSTRPQSRRRRRLRVSGMDEQQSFHQASASLANMEQLSAEATMAHAEATHRLAAAIEALSERLREPLCIKITRSPPRDTE